MTRMKAAQIAEPGGTFELVEHSVPEPGPNQVRVRVEACGLCHSDAFVKEGTFPGIQYPRIPGHEVIGSIDSVGSAITSWKPGNRVGVGWHGGHCGECDRCRVGDFITCRNAEITGITHDGGYADTLIASTDALAHMPPQLGAVEAAPLLCAGITTYNALRFSAARPGDVVAIQGVGGLGHLGIQYAQRMGFHTVALSHSSAKRDLAYNLGAHRYINSQSEDAVAILQGLGGARVVLATAPSAETMTAIIEGLGVDGELITVGADTEPIRVSPFQLLPGRRTIRGWPSGTPAGSEDTLHFSQLTGATPLVETYPLDQVEAAYQRMITNQARFRVVLTP